MTETAKALLWPFSALYAAATSLRNFYYDHVAAASHAAEIPVISIGNLTTGGTGKTPLVIEFVSRLKSMQRKPVILTRGYGGSSAHTADEVLEFRAALPDVSVVVDANRVRGAATARREHDADCVVLDDGFQHRRLRRALDVVVVDALNPWGGGRVLPAGRMREPARGIRRADLVIMTRRNLLPVEDESRAKQIVERLERDGCRCPIVMADVLPAELTDREGRAYQVRELAGRRVCAVCAIGNPHGFLRLIRSVGAEVCESFCFADHYRYQLSDLLRIRDAAAESRADWVVTTRKDWVKLAPLMTTTWESPGLLKLGMRMKLIDPDAIVDTLLRRAVEPAAT